MLCKYCNSPATIKFVYKFFAYNQHFVCDSCRDLFLEKLTEKNKSWYEEIEIAFDYMIEQSEKNILNY